MSKYTVASLFSGAGGLDIGLHQAGFKTIFANDIDQDACDTFKTWNSEADIYCGDITKLDTEEIPDVDIVTGGFPCQGFSLAGPRKLDDSRNVLYREFVRVVGAKKPYAFIGENVKGLLTLGSGAIMQAIMENFSSLGYNLYFDLLNASDYRVPQDRQRVILVGIREDIDQGFQFPKPTGLLTLREAIGHMPEPKDEDVSQAPFSPRFMSRNRKRGWDDVSYTIPAMAKQVTLHPSSPDMIRLGREEWTFGEGKTRRFSWQEAAVVQSFPEGMEFAGNLTSKYQQIGNAVPCELGRVVGEALHKTLDRSLKTEEESKENKEKVAI